MNHFHEELDQLEQSLLAMASFVEVAIHSSVSAFVDINETQARKVLAGEPRINQMQIDNDQFATRLIALNQPVARDLRFLTAVIKMNGDLERMGDLTVDIAERALFEAQPRRPVPSVDLSYIANRVQAMVSMSLQSFADRNEPLARAVLVADDEVDVLRVTAYEQVIAFVENNPGITKQGVDLLFAVHALARIADHATNIAEDVLQLLKGIDARRYANA